ncbi:macro domain-containing protein [Parvimonas parva]|uniref:Macro domain-containing protein n=1 Tax=Parvimonas parva TaxID=2769485 RepID=A0ABS1CC59_9FIRM|nr:macro domain-containing protein [Parvimonas parva]MBK1469142.1 macro domain-containing protein [Parvimonas parva]
MDIRVVSESIFDIESDCIVYFVDNAFSSEDTMELVSKAGDRLLDVFSKISSFATGEFKIVPAFNLKTTYVIISSIPQSIETEEDEKFLEEIFSNILSGIEKYEFNTIAVDVTRLLNSYSSKHSEVFKRFLRNVKKDIVVFMCK